MKQMDRPRGSMWRVSAGRIAAVAVAVGGLSAALAPSTALAAPSPATVTIVSTVQNAKLGTILVSGNTLYALKPGKTACDAKCLKKWPPALLPQGDTNYVVGPGLDASKFSTVTTASGLQATYAGTPLYWYSKDKAAGQVHGNISDKWGKWSTVVIAPSTTAPSTPPTSGGGSNAGTGGTSF